MFLLLHFYFIVFKLEHDNWTAIDDAVGIDQCRT
jgi:hypothetical protein